MTHRAYFATHRVARKFYKAVSRNGYFCEILPNGFGGYTVMWFG